MANKFVYWPEDDDSVPSQNPSALSHLEALGFPYNHGPGDPFLVGTAPADPSHMMSSYCLDAWTNYGQTYRTESMQPSLFPSQPGAISLGSQFDTPAPAVSDNLQPLPPSLGQTSPAGLYSHDSVFPNHEGHALAGPSPRASHTGGPIQAQTHPAPELDNASDEKRVCEWKNCPYPRPFNRKADVLRHVKEYHLSIKSYKCGNCDAAFSRKDRMREHVDKAHSSLGVGSKDYVIIDP